MADVFQLSDQRWCIRDERLVVEVDAARGGDINSIVLQSSGVELLWRNDAPAFSPIEDDGEPGFFDRYVGGIQELFPNAGPRTTVKGAPLPFHGEACRAAWTAAPSSDLDGALDLTVELRRYPFRLDRSISLLESRAGVVVRSTVTNLSSSEHSVHWGFHPVFSEHLTTGATLYGDFSAGVSDPRPFGRKQAFPPSQVLPIDAIDEVSSLALVEGDAGTADLSYIDAKQGWFVLAGDSGVAVALLWPVDLFPTLWLWQECRGTIDYPWWGRHHIVGVEPHSASPLMALEDEIETGAAMVIGPGKSIQAEFVMLVDTSETRGFVREVSVLARTRAEGENG